MFREIVGVAVVCELTKTCLIGRWRVLRRALHGGMAAVLGAGLLAACQPSGGARAPDEPKFGGTLNIVVGVKIEHLDPQWMSSANDVNLSRLYARTLTTFKSGPDAKGEVVGDLATDSGRPVGRNQVWEFTLRRDVKWQDGTPVTCAHVKYGVERNFSRLLTAGSSYPRQLLMDNTPGYEGPFARGNNDGQGLESVQCVDVRTIRFHLNQPMGDFGHAVALAAFAPVLPGADADKAAYERRPMSNPKLFDL